ncbi:MAG: dephospho-CoA kinase [Acholeplasmatales bacterium]|nr:dephospho-CoA kinase [Acholeplasmatales bacterium]
MNTVKNNKVIIGITGGIASGKSAVSTYLAKKGYVVIDADNIVSSLYEDESFKNELEGLFGTSKKVDIRNKVFYDEHARSILEKIIHPYVYKEIDYQINEKYIFDKIIFLDIPLLFETKYESNCDEVILVYTSADKQIDRIKKRNNLNEETIKNIISSQDSTSSKLLKASFKVRNSYSYSNLYKNVDKILDTIIKKYHLVKN